MIRICAFGAALTCALFSAVYAHAASLQVAPVLLEVPAPGAATTMTVRNTGDLPIMSQLRVYRWTQVNGQEKLDLTDDVVASPPMVELRPKQDYTVRIVRTAKHPVAGEESYRVVIDELPDARKQPGIIALVLRHSVPLFFVARQSAAAAPHYAITQSANGLTLRVSNQGDRRIQLSAIAIKNAAGRQVTFGPGLVGYALGRSTMQWTARSSANLGPPASLVITGKSETGNISAKPSGTVAP
jgi:fimbrial chaperone protein